jgi:type 1 glutamine amidotransferase
MSYHFFPRLNLLNFTIVLILLLVVHTETAQLSRILVVSETMGWDHQTRVVADSVISALGSANGFKVITTDNTDGYFTEAFLSNCAAVCFINTTGTIFTNDEATAFEQYMRNGGGYVGVHASTDCEYDRTWYAQMTGANFNGHPFNIATAKVKVLNKNHQSTDFIGQDTLLRTDEWYFWANNPGFQNKPLVDPAENDSITVLMELVESSIQGSSLNHFHPITWCKSYGSGRVWYCGFGHDPSTFKDPLMVKMLLGGIRYAAKIQSTGFNVKPNVDLKPTFRTINANIYDCMGRVVQPFCIIGSSDSYQLTYRFGVSYSNGVYPLQYNKNHLIFCK